MGHQDDRFLLIGAYTDEEGAQADYDVVKELHAAGVIGGFDAAVITKDAEGKVHVNKDETATRKGAWGGLGVGALVGILFPLRSSRARRSGRRSAASADISSRACPAPT